MQTPGVPLVGLAAAMVGGTGGLRWGEDVALDPPLAKCIAQGESQVRRFVGQDDPGAARADTCGSWMEPSERGRV